MQQNTLYKTMERYCVSCKKNTANTNSSDSRTIQNRLILIPSCAIFGKKKPRFIKNLEAIGLLSSVFRVKTPLSKIPLFGDIIKLLTIALF